MTEALLLVHGVGTSTGKFATTHSTQVVTKSPSYRGEVRPNNPGIVTGTGSEVVPLSDYMQTTLQSRATVPLQNGRTTAVISPRRWRESKTRAKHFGGTDDQFGQRDGRRLASVLDVHHNEVDT